MSEVLNTLETQLNLCLISDQYRLRRWLERLRKHPDALSQSQLEQALARSCAEVDARRQALPEVQFPASLPICERLDEVRDAIRANQVVVLCGETGSGKSTQLPKICLTLGLGQRGRIAHTQPRRIAARALAARVASELGQETGASVGYKVRFHDRVSAATSVKLMTDGMLLAEIQQDRFLNEYDCIILDEAHERSLNIDFLLGYLKQLLNRRPDLKLIVTSATIDPQRFSRHFGGAPVIEVSGRTYPVEIRYRPPQEADENERANPMQQAILDAVDELSGIDRGDILVFLSGEREIRETAEHLHKHRLRLTEVLPLYARLSHEEQARIFKPSGSRRIILSTNVAETSLTVPGIKYVIDTGFARISRYSPRSKIQRLPIEAVSRASAQQRSGRCGRVQAGVCIRLYAEDDFLGRTEFTEPEILRTNLASVILQMRLLGFADIEHFPFVDMPDMRLIKDGYQILEELGAVDGARKITRLGQMLAKLPVDPRIGRMMLEAAFIGCQKEMLVIASALSVQDVRERPLDKQQQADEAHAMFRHEDSDFLSWLNLWNFLQEQRQHLSKRKFRDLCTSHFLSPNRVQEWQDIHQQLQAQMHELGHKDNEQAGNYEQVHLALLSGLLGHVGFKAEGKEGGYAGARGSRFYVYPGSGLFKLQPKWVVAGELTETTKLYARNLGRVQPEWVEKMAGHLIKRHYSEPHWQAGRGQVAGYEKVTLYGLTLVPRRRINYGPLDPETARDIFIRFALVEGDFSTRAKFWRHNQELIQSVHDMEAKSRRPDILVDEERIYQFYEQRIPHGIYSTAQFESWLREAVKKEPRLLHMDLADLMRTPDHLVSAQQFPDELVVGNLKLPLEYRFEPGHEADGVTLVVPTSALNQLSEARLDYLVPGLLEDKLVSLIKGLPKELRKQFVPVPDSARKALPLIQPSDKPLIQSLAAALHKLSGQQVPDSAWDLGVLADFQRMRIRAIDAEGKAVAASRDLHQLQQLWGSSEHLAAPKGQQDLLRTGIKRWDFGSLPERVERKSGNIRLDGYPALVDEGESVAVRVLDSQAQAHRQHQLGLRRLIALSLPHEMRYLKKNLPDLKQMSLRYALAPGEDDGDLQSELMGLILDRTFILGFTEIRDEQGFNTRLSSEKGKLMANATQIHALIAEILGVYQELRTELGRMKQPNWRKSTEDVLSQLDGLIFKGFIQQVGSEHLQHYPRYLKAIKLRLEKLAHAAARDQTRMDEMAAIEANWLNRSQALAAKGRADERLDEIRWLLQELRVSLFAQELKTPQPVSVKRIEKRWAELGL